MIEDEIFWDAHEELSVRLDREPTHEEVIEYLKNKFSVSKEEEKEIKMRKIYGK